MASSSAYKRQLSGSTYGSGIEVVATESPGDLIHTAIASTAVGTVHEVWLWAQNRHTADVPLTLEFSSATANQRIVVTIPSKGGLCPVVPGFILQNSLTVKAFAATTAAITIFGFVNSITD